MVMEIKVNQYITVTLISAKRFKNIIFRLFALSFFKESTKRSKQNCKRIKK